MPPPPGRAKVAQTPGRARVKNSSSHVLDATYFEPFA